MTPLESLRERRAQIIDELVQAKAAKDGPRVTSKRQTLRHIDASIAKIKSEEARVVVSDHAILRYLERIEGVDIQAVKAKILTGNVAEQIQTLGSGELPLLTNSGVEARVMFRNYTVVTIQT